MGKEEEDWNEGSRKAHKEKKIHDDDDGVVFF